ncbi:hypothetical protein HBI14_163420 [Parastagonospora nodorum]|nr:hypothetical protein HBI14_163420 [Parastagonospora nodorum]
MNKDDQLLQPNPLNRKGSFQTDSSLDQSAPSAAGSTFSDPGTTTSSVAGGDLTTQRAPSSTLLIGSKEPGVKANASTGYCGMLSSPTNRPTTSVIKNNPHSKTAVGRLTYELTDLPPLFVATVETLCPKTSAQEPIDNWEAVAHKRLRKDAVREMIAKTIKVDDLANVAINQDGNGTLDQVVVPVSPETQALTQNLVPGQTELDHTKMMAKKAEADSKEEAASKAAAHRPVACKILPQKDIDDKKKAELYWKSFDSLIQMRTSQIDDPSGTSRHTCYIQDFPSVINGPNKINPFLCSQRAVPMEVGSGLSLGLRIQPSLNTDHKCLHLDFDLVAYDPKGSLHSALFDAFGKNGLLSKPLEHLTVLAGLLKGLQVRCKYVVEKDPLEPGKKASLLDSKNSYRGRLFRIADVKIPEDVKFNVGTETYTVASFFNERVLPTSQELQYPELPLVSDGKDHWVPLEMLIVEHAQPIHHKDFTRAGRGLARSVLSHKCATSKITMGKVLFEVASNVVFVPNVRDIVQQPAELAKKILARSNFEASINVAVAEDNVTGACRTHASFLTRIRQGLELPLSDDTSLVMAQAQVADIGTAAEVQKKKNSKTKLYNILHGTTATNRTRLVLGLMESSSMVRKQLRKFTDYEANTLLVDVTKDYMRKCIATRNNDDPYFPQSVMDKCNFKLGGTNYSTNVLDVGSGIDLSNLMVVGAHTRRPRDGHKTYSPSIAAVVASTDSAALQFPGSVTIQQTFDEYTTRGAEDKTTLTAPVLPRVLSLRSMMEKRFEAWSNPQKPPKDILFYRSGINFDNNATIEHEYQGIKAAFNSKWPGFEQPCITCVVYNKNAQITFFRDSQLSSKLDLDAATVPPAPEIVFGTNVGQAQKYKYYVLKNEIGFDEAELKQLTINLNESSQLSSQQDRTAKALPLVWASKLAARVHDYYYDTFKLEASVLSRNFKVEDDHNVVAAGAKCLF